MPSRRSILKNGAAVGVASVTGIAGCLGQGSSSGFEEWLIEPLRLSERPDRYSVISIAPASLDENANEFAREDYNDLRSFALDRYDFTRLYADEVDRVTVGGSGYNGFNANGFEIVQGGIDSESVGEDLTRSDYRALNEYEGFNLYEHDDEQQIGAGLGDDTMAMTASNNGTDAVRILEELIDTKQGNIRSYMDVDENFDALASASSPGDFFRANTQEPVEETDAESGRFRNQIGSSFSATVNGENADLEAVLTFLNESDPRERDIEDWTRQTDTLRLWRDLDFEIDGAVVTISGEAPTRDMLDALA